MFTDLVANQSARKTLSTVLVYTKFIYFLCEHICITLETVKQIHISSKLKAKNYNQVVNEKNKFTK